MIKAKGERENDSGLQPNSFCSGFCLRRPCFYSEAYTAALEQRHGGCFVAMLLRKRLIDRLRPYSGILQTIGLCCRPDEWEKLSYLLLRAGAVRVCRLEELGTPAPMDSHDGEWELLRYCREIAGCAVKSIFFIGRFNVNLYPAIWLHF